MLRLLSFLQTPRDWTGAELAERLEVSQRTIRNDIERLRSLGYQVQATRGPIGGYRLASGTTVPPLLLDDDEAVALAVALRTGAGGGTDGIEASSMRALAKLEQVLPARLRSRVQRAADAHRARAPALARHGRCGRPDDAGRDLPRPSRPAVRLRGSARIGQPASGRAPSGRPCGGPLVPGRLGYRPPGLADVQGRPDPLRGRRRTSDRGPRAVRRGDHRPGLSRRPGGGAPLSDARHDPRAGRGHRRADRSVGRHASSRSMPRPASSIPAPTTSRSSPSTSDCSTSTSS